MCRRLKKQSACCLLYYEENGEEHYAEYAALKCFEGDYHKQEWFLLGAYYTEFGYDDIIGANVFSSKGFTVEPEAVGTPTWQLIYFCDEENAADAP